MVISVLSHTNWAYWNCLSELCCICVRVKSHQLCPTLYDPMDYIACQAPLSMGFYRQEYWSGLPCPSPGDLPNPGFKPRSPALQVDSLPPEPPGKPQLINTVLLIHFKCWVNTCLKTKKGNIVFKGKQMLINSVPASVKEWQGDYDKFAPETLS